MFIMIIIFVFIFSNIDAVIESTKALAESQSFNFLSVDNYNLKEFAENLEEINFFVSSQWYSKNVGQMIPIFAIIFAFYSFNFELSNKHIYFSLNFFSRKYIYFSKLSGIILMMIIFISFLFVLPVILNNTDFNLLNHISYFFAYLVVSLLWTSISILFSILLVDIIKSLSIIISLLIITSFLGTISPLNFFNTFYYTISPNYINNILYFFLYLLTSILIFVLSYKLFIKKEL